MNHSGEIKADQIARMMVAGMSKTAIARELGMTFQGVTLLMEQPTYQAVEDEIRLRLNRKMDRYLNKRARLLEQDMEAAVPEALKVLLDRVKQKDLRAALEVLDREPSHRFTKASRTPDLNKVPAISSDALAKAIKEAERTVALINEEKPAEA